MRATDALLAYFFHLICVKTLPEPDLFSDNTFRRDYEQTENFFHRFGGGLDVKGRSVLDVGCGTGPSCIYAGLGGARRVVGVDMLPGRLIMRSLSSAGNTPNCPIPSNSTSQMGI